LAIAIQFYNNIGLQSYSPGVSVEHSGTYTAVLYTIANHQVCGGSLQCLQYSGSIVLRTIVYTNYPIAFVPHGSYYRRNLIRYIITWNNNSDVHLLLRA
jgi:hypothetical protein